MRLEHHGKCPYSDPSKMPQNGFSATDLKPDVSASSSQKIQIFVWLHLESRWALHTKAIEDILSLPMGINPSSYGQGFAGYDLQKLSDASGISALID
jgi:hypothetical protein